MSAKQNEAELHLKSPAETKPAPVSAPDRERQENEPSSEKIDAEQKPSQNHEQTRKIKFTPPKHRAIVLTPRDEITVKVEKILEEGLNDSFQRLSPIAKQEFKIKGEQTASQIRELLKSTHVKVKKIFRLILDWLRMLPGINRFFLEQEAKIKTDKIIALKKKV